MDTHETPDTLPVQVDGALPGGLPLDRPFTAAEALAAGMSRTRLQRAVVAGSLRRLLRGVYAASATPDDPATRRRALALVQRPHTVVTGRCAGWAHGLDPWTLGCRHDHLPLETVEAVCPRTGRPLPPHTAEAVDDIVVTTPLRTALDLGASLPEARALAALDGLLAGETGLTHPGLLGGLAGWGSGRPTVRAGRHAERGLRRLAALADGRSQGPAESVLRLAWHDARLPSAIPGVPVAAGDRVVRLALAVPGHRYGALVVAQGSPGPRHAAELTALQGAGWSVVVLSEARVLGGADGPDVEGLREHLEREFHQHLLADLG